MNKSLNCQVKSINKLLLCIIYRINLRQDYKIDKGREIHVAYVIYRALETVFLNNEKSVENRTCSELFFTTL